MQTELRRGTLILKGTNRNGRFDFSLATVNFFKEKNYPLPPEVDGLVNAKLNPPDPDLSDLVWKTSPWPHQLEGVKRWLKWKRFSLFHAMGAGKSMEALTGIGHLFRKGLAKRALILCPISVFSDWKKQYDRHATAGELIVLGDVKKAKKALTSLPEGAIVLTNYEKLKSLEKDLDGKFDVIVADEATKIKSPSAGRTKILARLASNAPYVLTMTGTPVSRNLVDVFGQYLVMDPFWFGKSFWMFKQRYCIMGGWMGHSIVGYQRESELRQIIDIASHRVTKEQALPHLPPKVFTERVCEMTPDQKKVYKDVQKKFWVEISDKGWNIDVKNAASRIMKLQEIANGFVIDNEGKIQDISNAKLECLADVIEEIDDHERITVWCRFNYDIKKIKELCATRFPDRRVFVLSGEVTGEDRERDIESFRTTQGSVLIANIQAGGLGIDLTCCRYPIIYSDVYEYALQAQMHDRHHRPGQHSAVTYTNIITENSVDRKIQEVLSCRKSLAQWLMEDRGRLSDFFDPGGVFRRR